MKSPLPWKLDEGDPSIIYDAHGNIIAEDYKFLHVDDFEAICKLIQQAVGMVDELKPKVQDLKWANGWGSKTPEIVLICRELEHKVSDIRDQTSGHVHTIRCNQCGYFYHYDSS